MVRDDLLKSPKQGQTRPDPGMIESGLFFLRYNRIPLMRKTLLAKSFENQMMWSYHQGRYPRFNPLKCELTFAGGNGFCATLGIRPWKSMASGRSAANRMSTRAVLYHVTE